MLRSALAQQPCSCSISRHSEVQTVWRSVCHVPAVLNRPKGLPACRIGKQPHQVRAAADDGAGASRQDDPPAFGSPGWRSRPAAISLPGSARDPGVWFVLAGFVRLAALTMSMGTSPFGGLGDLVVVLPVAAVLGLLGKWVVQNNLMQRKWFARILIVATLAFLYISSLAYKRTLMKRFMQQQAAEPQAAAVMHRPQPAVRRLPSAAEAEAAGVEWQRPTRENRTRNK